MEDRSIHVQLPNDPMSNLLRVLVVLHMYQYDSLALLPLLLFSNGLPTSPHTANKELRLERILERKQLIHNPVAQPNVLSLAPPGSLLFAHYKVDTCLDAEDLAIHVLNSTLHLLVNLHHLEPPMSIERLMYEDTVSSASKASLFQEIHIVMIDSIIQEGSSMEPGLITNTTHQGIAILNWD
jgi:hypothetical protein